MLFSATYISKNIQDFQVLVEYFFRQLATNTHAAFSDTLFPLDQRTKLYKYGNAVNGYKKFVEVFEAIFKLYNSKSFSRAHKQKLIDDFFASNAIDDICNNLALHPSHYEDMDKRVQKVAVLFNTLYDSYFSDVVNKKEHLEEHESSNGKICPICGMNTTYPYDHFLPKGITKPIFPFSCVNPKNLLPICQDCNGPKSSKLIIYQNSSRANARLLAFSPYNGFDTWENLDFELTNISKPGVSTGGEWKVSFTLKDENLDADKQLKIDQWRKFYQIEERFSKEIEKFVKNWIHEYQENGKTLDDMISDTEPNKRNIRRVNGILLQNLLFKFMNSNAEIMALFSPAIDTAQNPAELLELQSGMQ